VPGAMYSLRSAMRGLAGREHNNSHRDRRLYADKVRQVFLSRWYGYEELLGKGVEVRSQLYLGYSDSCGEGDEGLKRNESDLVT
jgi:hypothetical protein